MSSQPEDQRAASLTELLGFNTPGQQSSLVGSVQSLRDVAQKLTLREIAEAEKSVSEFIAQLTALQEALHNLSEFKLFFHEGSTRNRGATKTRNLSRGSGPNVIPFPSLARSAEAHPSSAQPKPDDAPTAERSDDSGTRSSLNADLPPSDHARQPQQEPHKPVPRVDVQDAPVSRHQDNIELPDLSLAQSVPETESRSESKAQVAPEPEVLPETNFVMQDAPRPVPEVVAPQRKPPASDQQSALPSQRAAVDQEIRELVRSYGQVDIYTHREGDEKQNLPKAVIAIVFLLAFLLASYFFTL